MAYRFKESNINLEGVIYISINGNIKEAPVFGLSSGNSGIYEIVNPLNGKRYIGQAKNLYNRMLRHWRDLKNGNHHADQSMKEDYKKFNEFTAKGDGSDFEPSEFFEFRVIIFCRPSELSFYENLLIRYLNPEYNKRKQKPLVMEE